MKPIKPAELSAYLDRELDPRRHREIASALDHDAALRAELDTLARLDATWRDAAASARFRPSVRLPRGQGFVRRSLGIALLAVCLLAVRFVPQLSDAMVWGFLLHGVVLAVVGAWLVRLTDRDRSTMMPVSIEMKRT